MTMEQGFRWKVTHPELGTVEVIAPDRLKALTRASKEWKQRWTQIARACTVERLGEADD